jgi:hypothetical protein
MANSRAAANRALAGIRRIESSGSPDYTPAANSVNSLFFRRVGFRKCVPRKKEK